MICGHTEEATLVVHFGRHPIVVATLGREFLKTGVIQAHRIGERREQDVVLVQVEPTSRLDRGDEVSDRGNAQERQFVHVSRGDSACEKYVSACRLVEQPQEPQGGFVVDRRHHVGVAGVVNPGNVLVPNALDAVASEARTKKGGTLKRLGGSDPAARAVLLEIVAGSERTCGPRRAHPRCQPVGRSSEPFVRRLYGWPRHSIVPQVVAEFVELVEYDGFRANPADLPAGVEDLLHVALAPWRRDDLGPHPLQPFEALTAHFLGQDRDGRTTEQGAVEHSAPAVVAGGRPHSPMSRGIELAGDESGYEATEGGAHFVRPGREPLAYQAYDARWNSGQLRRNLERVHVAESTRSAVIAPRNPKQVQRIGRLHVEVDQRFGDGRVHPGGIPLLRQGRDQHAQLTAPGHCAVPRGRVDDLHQTFSFPTPGAGPR